MYKPEEVQELRELLQSLKTSKPEAWRRIPELFRSLRNDCNFTQSQIANEAGITHNAVCMVEAGTPAISADKIELMLDTMINYVESKEAQQ